MWGREVSGCERLDDFFVGVTCLLRVVVFQAPTPSGVLQREVTYGTRLRRDVIGPRPLALMPLFAPPPFRSTTRPAVI